MNKNNKMVPKLRFGEFEDNWEELQIKDIISSVTKGTTPKSYSDEGINFIKVENIVDNKIVEIGAWIDEFTHNNELNRSILKNNDLLFSIAGSLGRTAIITEDILPANTNQALSIIRLSNLGEVNIEFLQSRLNCQDIDKYVFQNLAVGAQPNLNLKQVENIKFKLPSKQEQDKIQRFISLIDKKHESFKKKHKELVDFKKYLMQSIFSQKLRFTGFNKEWKNVKIKDIFKVVNGKGLSKEKIDEDGKFNCILYGELYTTYKEIIKSVVSKTNYDEGVSSQKGDILMPSSTTTKGIDLVNATVILEENVKIGGDITILRKKNNLNSEFFAYYLSHGKTKEITRLTQGSTIIHLYWEHIKNLNIQTPTLEEQEKIASFLTQIDKKIRVIENHIKEIEKFKKGLLQQMFI